MSYSGTNRSVDIRAIALFESLARSDSLAQIIVGIDMARDRTTALVNLAPEADGGTFVPFSVYIHQERAERKHPL